MKKIGILYGRERSFPRAFVDKVNSMNVDGIVAEPVKIDKVQQGHPSGYAVIIDRISQDVPFYRAYLKNAAATGTAVVNNPFWWSADEKFFNNVFAVANEVPVPKTVLLPSNQHPDDTTSESFDNLTFPLDWEGIFNYVGFPAYMKPFAGGGWKNVYKIKDANDLWNKYGETEQLVMMLQEEIKFDSYFRCYGIGGKYVKIMHYEPRNPHHLRYDAHFDVSDDLMQRMHDLVLKICRGLGYDFNTVEFAVRDGVPYAIDFCNPAPDAEETSVGRENFEWVVETAAKFAVERAQAHQDGQDNLTWGDWISKSVNSSGKSTTPQRTAKKKMPTKSSMQNRTVGEVKSAQVLSAAAAKKVNDSLLNSIGSAKAGERDDLKKISGVGPKLEGILNSLGIYTFEQVSKMKKKEYEMVDQLLTTFKGRAKRDDWAGQAKKLK